jgi:hypothetical protein
VPIAQGSQVKDQFEWEDLQGSLRVESGNQIFSTDHFEEFSYLILYHSGKYNCQYRFRGRFLSTKSYMLSRQALKAFCRGHLGKLFLAQQLSCTEARPIPRISLRTATSSSSTRWKSRQGRDSFAREAKVQGLKSRAAFKLLEVCFLFNGHMKVAADLICAP